MNKISIEIKWGILFSIVTLVWMIIEYSFGLHDKHIDKQPIYTNLFAILAIGIYFLALKDKKNLFYNGKMSWKQGFISGIILSIVIAFLSPLVQYISFTIISPNFFQNIIKYAVENEVKTEAQAEIYFTLKSYIIRGISDSLSMGVITAAFVSLILKTKNT